MYPFPCLHDRSNYKQILQSTNGISNTILACDAVMDPCWAAVQACESDDTMDVILAFYNVLTQEQRVREILADFNLVLADVTA